MGDLPEPPEVPFLEWEPYEVPLKGLDDQLRRIKEFLTKYQSFYPCVQLMLGMKKLTQVVFKMAANTKEAFAESLE